MPHEFTPMDVFSACVSTRDAGDEGRMIKQQALHLVLHDPALWRSSQQVGQMLDPVTRDPKGAAGKARREEQVFAAWDGERYRYPAFQFDGDRCIRPLTSALVAVLPRDRDGRINLDATLWAFSPTAALDKRTPAEVFATDPEAVIELARRLRDGLPDLDFASCSQVCTDRTR